MESWLVSGRRTAHATSSSSSTEVMPAFVPAEMAAASPRVASAKGRPLAGVGRKLRAALCDLLSLK